VRFFFPALFFPFYPVTNRFESDRDPGTGGKRRRGSPQTDETIIFRKLHPLCRFFPHCGDKLLLFSFFIIILLLFITLFGGKIHKTG
jgi:hypothetical protein